MAQGQEKQTVDSSEVINPYDAVEYQSFSYKHTTPQHLYTVAKILGIDAPDYKTGRVLELGCASGGNVFAHAIQNPDSKVVGIDLSQKQIDDGNNKLTKLGLANLELKCVSILDITKEFGEFDYIIVHGILSWVPQEVRDKIFAVCKENLSENGLAYISYNCLPGWNMIKSIREMMLYHTENSKTDAEKVQQARLLLNFIYEGNKDKDNAYSKLIKSEIDNLKTHSDHYLFHDHLENDNHAYYFTDFVKELEKQDLKYVSDVILASMYADNLPPEISSVLGTVGNDVIKSEQYLDFINNRRFRTSIISHKALEFDRNINSDDLLDLYVTTDYRQKDKTALYDAFAGKEVEYVANAGSSLNTSNSVIILMLTALNQAPWKPKKVSDVVDSVMKTLKEKKMDKGAGSKKEITKFIANNLLRFYLADTMKFSVTDFGIAEKLSEKPLAFDVARMDASYRETVTTIDAGVVKVDSFKRVLLQYLDGENTLDQLVDLMGQHVKSGELTLNVDDKPITEDADIKTVLQQYIPQQVTQLLVSGVLEK